MFDFDTVCVRKAYSNCTLGEKEERDITATSLSEL